MHTFCGIRWVATVTKTAHVEMEGNRVYTSCLEPREGFEEVHVRHRLLGALEEIIPVA